MTNKPYETTPRLDIKFLVPETVLFLIRKPPQKGDFLIRKKYHQKRRFSDQKTMIFWGFSDQKFTFSDKWK